MNNTNILKFQPQSNQNLSLESRVKEVIDYRMRSLISRARIATGNLTSQKESDLEEKTLEFHNLSQSKSSLQINQAMSELDHKMFQTIAVQIAVLMNDKKYKAADAVFQEVTALFEFQTLSLLMPCDNYSERKLAA